MAHEGDLLAAQIDELLRRGNINPNATYTTAHNFEYVDEEQGIALGAAWVAAIRRLTPAESPYRELAESVGLYATREGDLERLANVLIQLRGDLRHGYFREVSELVHADLFDDFLDMATELLDKNYKDAAAVIASSVLEEHIRKLALKAGVAIVTSDNRPKRADWPGPR